MHRAVSKQIFTRGEDLLDNGLEFDGGEGWHRLENKMERRRIAIVGVGLIGGSLALQLNEKGLASRLIGVDSNRDHQKKAMEMKLVDEVMDIDDAIKLFAGFWP